VKAKLHFVGSDHNSFWFVHRELIFIIFSLSGKPFYPSHDLLLCHPISLLEISSFDIKLYCWNYFKCHVYFVLLRWLQKSTAEVKKEFDKVLLCDMLWFSLINLLLFDFLVHCSSDFIWNFDIDATAWKHLPK